LLKNHLHHSMLSLNCKINLEIFTIFDINNDNN